MTVRAEASPGDEYRIPARVELVIGDDGKATLRFHGDWTIQGRPPTVDETLRELDQHPGIRSLGFAIDDLGAWDSALVTFLMQVIAASNARKLETDQSALPDGVKGLLKLAYAVPERTGARRVEKSEPFLVHLGKDFIDLVQSTGEIVAFLGLSVLSFWRFLTGKHVTENPICG
jgi:phospholipid/cholesterol/gamma-HCH transport system permease protein